MTLTPAYAGRLERLLAYMLDILFMTVPSMIIAKLLGSHSPLALLGMFLSNIAYYTAFTSSNWQATPGKRILGMYVAKLGGGKLTQRDALERFLGFAIPTLPMYLSVASPEVLSIITLYLSLGWYAPILFRPDRAGVHDLLCRTRVLVGKR